MGPVRNRHLRTPQGICLEHSQPVAFGVPWVRYPTVRLSRLWHPISWFIGCREAQQVRRGIEGDSGSCCFHSAHEGVFRHAVEEIADLKPEVKLPNLTCWEPWGVALQFVVALGLWPQRGLIAKTWASRMIAPSPLLPKESIQPHAGKWYELNCGERENKGV